MSSRALGVLATIVEGPFMSATSPSPPPRGRSQSSDPKPLRDLGISFGRELCADSERVARDLVLLVPYPLPFVAARVQAFCEYVERWHSGERPPPLKGPPQGPGRVRIPARTSRLAEDHGTLSQTVTELRGLLNILRSEDQMGHRQALGQYWKVAIVSLRHHLDEEARDGGSSDDFDSPPNGHHS
jgi:hypothetical protein